MRMWMIPPEQLCRSHLLGEHVEIHMLCGTLLKGKSIQGYIDNGLVEPNRLEQRHFALVEEMRRRGYRHVSPIDFEAVMLRKSFPDNVVDVQKSINDLRQRCKDCSTKMGVL